jgi:hypothetical protein
VRAKIRFFSETSKGKAEKIFARKKKDRIPTALGVAGKGEKMCIFEKAVPFVDKLRVINC